MIALCNKKGLSIIFNILVRIFVQTKFKNMNYKQNDLHRFIKKRKAFNLSAIERELEMPEGTLRHFIKERRAIPEIHLEKLEEYMTAYGYCNMIVT